MGTQEPSRAILQRSDRPVLNCRRTHQAADFFWRLPSGGRRNSHFLSQDIATFAKRLSLSHL
jgi:hypothetical protein